MKMPICAVLLGAVHAAAFASTGGACVDMEPALVKNFFEDTVAKLPEEQQMQVAKEEIPGTCEEVAAAGGCAVMTKECCATCGDVVQSRSVGTSCGFAGCGGCPNWFWRWVCGFL